MEQTKTWAPLGNRVCIKAAKPSEYSSGAAGVKIYLPENLRNSNEGIVLAVGPAAFRDETKDLVGRRVLFLRFAAFAVDDGIDKVFIVFDHDVVAVEDDDAQSVSPEKELPLSGGGLHDRPKAKWEWTQPEPQKSVA